MAVSLSINNPIDGNNFINASNVANGITISGTSSDSILADLVGQTVSVVLNGKTYTGTIGSGGSWSVSVGAADLAALTNGTTYTVTASVTDLAGKKASSADKVAVDETATLAIKAIDGNGFINAKSATGAITISGTSTGGLGTGDFAGQPVTVTLNGKSYTATIAANGTWSVNVSAADVAALTNGQSYTVTATATDKSGNAASTSSSVTVDEQASLSINPIDGNNYINASNAANGITVAGSSRDSILANLVGQSVSVLLNGKTYTGTIGSGGTWSVDVSPADLAALTNGKTYTVTASVTDLAGNKASSTDKVVVDETATLAIKAIDGNGFINGKNAAAGGITISGTSTGGIGSGDFAGQPITVALNGKSYTATIAANGTWSVVVGAADVAALTDGQSYTVTASAADKSDNAASTSSSVTVDEQASLSIRPIDGNNYINTSNAANGISITGSSSDSILANLVGQSVSVVLNGKAYTGTIGNDGSWSVNVGATDLAALTNGTTYTVTASVTDLAGNKASSTDRVIVDETATLAIKTIDGNGYINAKNAAAGTITISGTSTGGIGTGDFAGQPVTVTLNSKSYTATIAANGTWSVNVSAADVAALTDGQSYTVTASATDKSGNAASTEQFCHR